MNSLRLAVLVSALVLVLAAVQFFVFSPAFISDVYEDGLTPMFVLLAPLAGWCLASLLLLGNLIVLIAKRKWSDRRIIGIWVSSLVFACFGFWGAFRVLVSYSNAA